MQKILVSLMAIVMLCTCMTALADGKITITTQQQKNTAEGEAVTLQLNTERLPVYSSGSSLLKGLLSEEGDSTLSVLVIPVRQGMSLQTTVQPASVTDRRVTLAVEDTSIVRVDGNYVTALAAGETVLTITSVYDPSATLQYRILCVQPVERVTVTLSGNSVAVGETASLTATVLPENASIKDVIWTSQDERVATVDANGVVTGVKRGNAYILATARDGSNVRGGINVNVVQKAEQITLDKQEVTVDTGRSASLRATVLPQDTNDKNVVWSSSDESIAVVNEYGQVRGVSLGECEIICTSKTVPEVMAKATVHVQQPVTGVSFAAAPAVYARESAKLSWTVEPANASNPKLTFTSNNPSVLTISEDGTVTGVKAGDAYVTATTTDGSNRTARVKVTVYQHVEGVEMKRSTAYIDPKASNVTGAVFTPKEATNKNMTWTIEDTSIATIEPVKNQPWRVRITGVSEGQTILTGTTEDGGLQASMTVRVGSFEDSLRMNKNGTYVKDGNVVIRVQNVSNLVITSVTATVTATDANGQPVACNPDGSNTYKMTYNRTLNPGDSTGEKWKLVDYAAPTTAVAQYEVRITTFQIDNDWILTIRKHKQPNKVCPVQ